MALRQPTPTGQRLLEQFPEAREVRRAQRKVDIPLPATGGPVRGRRRSEVPTNQLLPVTADVIDPAVIARLALSLKDEDGIHRPVFTQFTDHYNVSPDRENISRYLQGSVKTAQPRPRTGQHEELRQYKAARRRQAFNVGDLLQREALTNRNTARIRRFGLMTTRFLFDHDREPDADALTIATDAVDDFGRSLSHHSSELLAPLGDEDLGYQITVIGTVALHDPSILRDNSDLMRLVQIEQKAREEHWGTLFDATMAHPAIGNRLTPIDREIEQDQAQELARLALLRQD